MADFFYDKLGRQKKIYRDQLHPRHADKTDAEKIQLMKKAIRKLEAKGLKGRPKLSEGEKLRRAIARKNAAQ